MFDDVELSDLLILFTMNIRAILEGDLDVRCRQKLVLVVPPLILQQWYDIRTLNRPSVPFQLFSAGLVPNTHISCHIIVVVSMPPPDFLSLESWSWCKGKNLITRLWILSHNVCKVFTSRNRNNKLTVVKLCIVHWKSNSKIKSWGVENSRRDS